MMNEGKNIGKTLRDYALMTLGIVMLTAGVYFFKIPNGFSTGGVSGFGTLMGKLTVITPATWIAILNVLLLIVGFIFLGKGTGIRTVYCSLLFSALTNVFQYSLPLTHPLTDQPVLELMYAMILSAAGSAIVFNCGSTSGGTDIVALILKKYTNLDVGKALLVVDFGIALSATFVFNLQTGLFSLMGLFMKAFLVDGIIESMNICKYFVIVTTKPDEVVDFITESLHHGATVVRAQGAYTHDNKTMLHTVCRRIEAIKLRRKIREIDPGSFVIVTDSSEIIGRGFRGI